MLPATPPRMRFMESTRKLTVSMWTFSGRMWSLKCPGKFMM